MLVSNLQEQEQERSPDYTSPTPIRTEMFNDANVPASDLGEVGEVAGHQQR